MASYPDDQETPPDIPGFEQINPTGVTITSNHPGVTVNSNWPLSEVTRGKVWILVGTIPYEGSDVLGVFTHKLFAEDEMIKRQAIVSRYEIYEIEAWELNTQEQLHAQS